MPEDTQPPKDEVLSPYSTGAKKTQPPGNSSLKQSCTRTCIREAFLSSTPELKYTDSIFNQMPDGGKPEAERLLVACRLTEEEARLPGTASAGVQYNNVKPATHHQHLIPEQEPALQREAKRSCFTLEFFRQFLLRRTAFLLSILLLQHRMAVREGGQSKACHGRGDSQEGAIAPPATTSK